MTELNPDAVQAAAQALREYGWTCEYHEPETRRGECSQCDESHDRSAAEVIAAAAPIIAAQVRAEVAAEIRHRLDRFQGVIDDMSPTDWGARLGLLTALEIVEPSSARIADPTGGA